MLLRVMEQRSRVTEDRRRRRPDEPGDTCPDPFGPLGHVPEHQDRLPEDRRFLLDSGGSGQDEVRLPQDLDEARIVERRHEPDSLDPRETGQDDPPNVRVQVNGEDDYDADDASIDLLGKRRIVLVRP
jgi:hypothetical protein